MSLSIAHMRLSRQIFSYSVFNVVNAAVPFLLLPILTAYLLPSAFGLLSLVTMMQAVLLPIVSISFQGLLTVEYSKLSSDQFKRFVASVMWLPVVGFLISFPLIFIFSNRVASLFGIPAYWVIASMFFVLLQALPLFMPVLFQARQQLVTYGIYKIGLTLLNVAFSLYFVICLNLGWEGRMWGILAALIIFNIMSLWMLRREGLLTLRFHMPYFKEGLRFGIPLIPHAVSGIMLSMADRVFLVNLATTDAVGIYSVASQLASALMIILSSVNQAWVPHLVSQLNSQPTLQDKRRIVLQTYKIMGLMLIGTMIFMAMLPSIYSIYIPPIYSEGLSISLWISAALMCQGFYFMVTNYIFYVKKSHLLSIMTMSSALLLMLLNYILIPLYGMFGAAYSALICWGALFVLAWILASKVYPMPWMPTSRSAEK